MGVGGRNVGFAGCWGVRKGCRGVGWEGGCRGRWAIWPGREREKERVKERGREKEKEHEVKVEVLALPGGLVLMM